VEGILTNGLSGAAVKQSLKVGNITNTVEGCDSKNSAWRNRKGCK